MLRTIEESKSAFDLACEFNLQALRVRLTYLTPPAKSELILSRKDNKTALSILLNHLSLSNLFKNFDHGQRTRALFTEGGISKKLEVIIDFISYFANFLTIDEVYKSLIHKADRNKHPPSWYSLYRKNRRLIIDEDRASGSVKLFL